METYEIISDGQKFIFHVIKNTTTPCPACGIPACGKEDILWYEKGDQRMAIIVNGSDLDLAIGEFLNKHVKPIHYGSLPNFIREWNEARGWENCGDYDGYELQIDDFLQSIELLKSCDMEKWAAGGSLKDMQKLAYTAQEIGTKLKIVRG